MLSLFVVVLTSFLSVATAVVDMTLLKEEEAAEEQDQPEEDLLEEVV